MTPLATDDRRALDVARDASRLAKEALQAARATKECRALRHERQDGWPTTRDSSKKRSRRPYSV